MRDAGIVIMISMLAASVIYLMIEKLITRKPLPVPVQRIYIGIGAISVVTSFTLYFLGS